MKDHIKDIILKSTGAADCSEKETIQDLWSGYGKIKKIELFNAEITSVIIKHIDFSRPNPHPRGWNTDFSHQRKLKSYQVETNWYKDYSMNTDACCRIPKCFTVKALPEEIIIVMEDLDASGFQIRKSKVRNQEIEECLRWLACFHAQFMFSKTDGLWDIGTYWNLATRPEEFEILEDKSLKLAAASIDAVLNNCKFKTLVHGDAKLANFCFSSNNQVSAVDFQYVGGGCGMKDVIYFLGSCLSEIECEKQESTILNFYFNELKQALGKSFLEFNALEAEWREMYAVAWTDFHRFLKGWSPGHWKINSYSEKLAAQVIKKYSM